MTDTFYPTIDQQFLESCISHSTKVIPGSKKQIGKTTMFVLSGSSFISKRIILLRPIIPNEVYYEQAVGIAIKLNFLSELMEWLEKYRNWKEGAYIVRQHVPTI